MPASDLPLNLRMLLDSITDNNMLRSWQIYNERNGITVKLRFNSPAETQQGEAQQGVGASGGHLSFVRKSPSQQRRDNGRKQQRPTMKTRSQTVLNAEPPVEKPRALNDSYQYYDNPTMSPMSVTADLDPNSPVFLPQSTPQSVGQCDSQVARDQVGHGSVVKDINSATYQEDHSKQETDQSTLHSGDITDSESDEEQVESCIKCIDYRCSYGPSQLDMSGDRTLTSDMYECTHPKCSGVYIYTNCK